MDWNMIIEQLITVCVIPLLGILAKFLIDFLTAKKNEIAQKTDSELAKKYLDMLNETVADCVNATTQTYVEALKKDGAFTKENQKEALQKTYDEVLNILSDDAKEYLKEACGDLESQIKTKIEAKVKETK